MRDDSHIVFISSWYPTPEDPTLGIFNRYFALAAARFNRVTILHVRSDEQVQSTEVRTEMQDGLPLVLVKYKKVQDRLPLFSAIKRRQLVISAFEMGWEQVVKNYGPPDLIHLNVAMPMGIAVLHLHRKHNIPFVLNENWSGYCAEDGNYKGFIQTYYTKKIIARASCIMPTSTFLRDAMLSHGLNGNYRVVPNVVNCDVFRPLELPAHEGTRLIHISSLNDREKNVSGLIRGFAAAYQKDNTLQLDIVGDGPDRKLYEELVSKLGVQQVVHFPGRLYAAELVERINAADALVMFSHYETFCLVNIEAFACGKPVITSRVGGIPGYMRPELGMLVESGDEAGLATALLDFAQNKSRYRSKDIRQYAVDHFSYEVVGRDLTEIYAQALQHPRG